MIQYKVRPHTRCIIIHDSHTKPSTPDTVSVLRWQGRKRGLMEIGYHYTIDRDGVETECRPLPMVGTHCQGHDFDSVGICLIGGVGEASGLPEDNFTDAQRESLFLLISRLKGYYGPELALLGHDEAIKGFRHHEDRRFTCPALDMFDLRADYHTYIQTGALLA